MPLSRDQRRWARTGNVLCWLALASALLYVAAAYAPGRLHYFMRHDSDAMFIPIFFRESLERGSVAGWDLPTNPYFFPDMALFIPLLAIFEQVHIANLLYGVAQLALLALGMVGLQRDLFARTPHATQLMLLNLVVCLVLIGQGTQYFYALLTISVHHAGVLVVLPFATLLLLRARQSDPPLWGLLALIFLTALSDTLFSVQFVLPALLTLVLAWLVWGQTSGLSGRRFLLITTGVGIAAGAGEVLRQQIVPLEKLLIYTNQSNASAIPEAWVNLAVWAVGVAQEEPLLVVWWGLMVAALGVVLSHAGRGVRQTNVANDALPFVAILFLASALVSLVVAVASGNYFDKTSTRYILPTLFLPLLAGAPLLLGQWLTTSRTWPNRFTPLPGLFAIGAIGFMLLSGQPLNFTELARYQDPFTACMVRESEARQIRHGLAGYWLADSTTALSNYQLRIVSLDTNLAPVAWNNNPARYQAPFEFVIMHVRTSPQWQIHGETLLRKFGPPADTFVCGSAGVYVYNRPADVALRRYFANRPEFVRLDAVGDVATLHGFALPSNIDGKSIGLSQGASEAWGQRAGPLAFSELPRLRAGSYVVAADLFTDSANTGAVEVHDITEGTPVVLAAQPINALGKNHLRIDFTLPDTRDILVLVQYSGQGALFLDTLHLARVDPAEAATYEFTAPAPPVAATPHLHLIAPHANAVIEKRTVDFAWQWTGEPLPEGQAFEVRLWRAEDTIHYGAHDAATGQTLIRQLGDTYVLRLDLNGAHSILQHGAGDYLWSVAIVALEPTYQDLQIEATPHALRVLHETTGSITD